MENLKFFTPISSINQHKEYFDWLIEIVDDYFFLQGKKAFVVDLKKPLDQRQIIFENEKSNWIIVALKITSYITFIIPILFISLKLFLRSKIDYKVINVKDIVNEGIYLKNESLVLLEKNIYKLERGQALNEVEYLYKEREIIFKLKSEPNYLFKAPFLGLESSLNHCLERFKKQLVRAIETQTSILAYHFSDLKVAKRKLLLIQGFPILVFKQEDFYALNWSERNFAHKKEFLNPAIMQLIELFLMKDYIACDFSSLIVEDKVLNSSLGGYLSLFIFKYSVSIDDKIANLISMLFSEHQIDEVICYAKNKGVFISSYIKEAKENRMRFLREELAICLFYLQHGITKNPLKAIDIIFKDLHDIHLNETKNYFTSSLPYQPGKTNVKLKSKSITFKEALEEIIQLINHSIKISHETSKIKLRRFVSIDRADLTWFDHKNPDAIYEDPWIIEIGNILKDKGCIFDVTFSDGKLLIQA
jgi:hypothetical protein